MWFTAPSEGLVADWNEHLVRWERAGVVDAATAGRVRAFEAAEAWTAGRRWQVTVALLLGGILLGAGLLLFVAAHWDEVSPVGRLALVLGMLAVVHGGAIVAAEKFPAMATALHGVGTVGAGAAIAMVGQIFNMQEHWPAAVMLWAGCAAVGYALLRDQFQQICLLLLGPAWVVCEWSYRADGYHEGFVYVLRMVAVLAAVYLTSFVRTERRAVFGVLFGISAVALVVAATELSDGWGERMAMDGDAHLTWGLRVGALVLVAATLAGGWLRERRGWPVTVAVTAAAFALPWLQRTVHGEHGDTKESGLMMYVVVAGVAMVMVWWGVRERSRAVVNYGVIGFALTVVWFYFSSLMDKFGRSLGLIGLGILFLLGGWLLERLRRRLMEQMSEVRA